MAADWSEEFPEVCARLYDWGSWYSSAEGVKVKLPSVQPMFRHMASGYPEQPEESRSFDADSAQETDQLIATVCNEMDQRCLRFVYAYRMSNTEAASLITQDQINLVRMRLQAENLWDYQLIDDRAERHTVIGIRKRKMREATLTNKDFKIMTGHAVAKIAGALQMRRDYENTG